MLTSIFDDLFESVIIDIYGENNIDSALEDMSEILEEAVPAGWAGSVRAMMIHYPKKFGKGKGKMNPYALAWMMKKRGFKPHYKSQYSSLKGRPAKKEEYTKKRKGK